jgi:hypothetical protein
MNCYYCEIGPHPGGVRYGGTPAVGVCQGCGAGLCLEHAHRAGPAMPLLCPDCARRPARPADDLAAPAARERAGARR